MFAAPLPAQPHGVQAGNIFLTKQGRIKLGDFGIARVLGSSHEMASTVVGTPYYLAPEVIEGKRYSTPADMWCDIIPLSRSLTVCTSGLLVYCFTRWRL